MFSAIFFFLFCFSDAEFLQMLLDNNESDWQILSDPSLSLEENVPPLALLADRLARWVPRSFLNEHAADLHGTIVFAAKITDKKTEWNMPLYRCTMRLDESQINESAANFSAGELIDIFVPAIPQAWALNIPISEKSAAAAIYIKTYDGKPAYIAPDLRWYPDTLLGNIGFDVSSFDHVPAMRVTDWGKNDEETNRQTFLFTEADREPFYGLLKAVSELPKGWLGKEAEKQRTQKPFSETDLFNAPHEVRGKPVLLRGIVKRIIFTPVKDSEVHALFGIDHYYQLYLFTEHSQGHPLVVCVRSLPTGLLPNDDRDFAERITVAAIPYKLWVYNTRQGPHYAPILAGSSLDWHPSADGSKANVPKAATAFSFAVFFTLVLIWFACRYWTRRQYKPVRRKKKQNP